MSGIVLDDAVIERLRERHPAFHEMSYVFVLSALHYVLQRLPETRHISGRELTEGVRDLARERFGPMARSVLEHWGIRETVDVGGRRHRIRARRGRCTHQAGRRHARGVRGRVRFR
jgi:hypothetical protein